MAGVVDVAEIESALRNIACEATAFRPPLDPAASVRS